MCFYNNVQCIDKEVYYYESTFQHKIKQKNFCHSIFFLEKKTFFLQWNVLLLSGVLSTATLKIDNFDF